MNIIYYQRYVGVKTSSKLRNRYQLMRSVNNVLAAIAQYVGSNNILSWKPDTKPNNPVIKYSDVDISSNLYSITYDDADQFSNYDLAIAANNLDPYNPAEFTADIDDLKRSIDKSKQWIYYIADYEELLTKFSTICWLLDSLGTEYYNKLACIVSISKGLSIRLSKMFPHTKVCYLPNLMYADNSYIPIYNVLYSDKEYDLCMLKHIKTWKPVLLKLKLLDGGPRILLLENTGMNKKNINELSSVLNITANHYMIGDTVDAINKKVSQSVLYNGISWLHDKPVIFDWTTHKVFECYYGGSLPILGKNDFSEKLLRNCPELVIDSDYTSNNTDINNVIDIIHEMSEHEYREYVNQYRKNVIDTYSINSWSSNIAEIVETLS